MSRLTFPALAHARLHSIVCDFRFRQLDEAAIFKSIEYILIAEEDGGNRRKFQIKRHDGAEAFIELDKSIHTNTFSIYAPIDFLDV